MQELSSLKRLLKFPQNHSFFLFGPRQTGKSTLLKEVFPEESSIYYDLLDTTEYLRLLKNPSLLSKEVFSRSPCISHVIIDEIQRIPELLNEVHLILESKKNPPYFCLSGSSARKLKRGQANLLGGRALTYSLAPLTINELGDQFYLNKALSLGTLPKVYLEHDKEIAKDILRSYVGTYLEEEIKAEALVRSLDSFVEFLHFAALENGNILNYSNIARDTGTSSITIKEYFHILEDTLLGFFLLPYSKSHREKIIKHPKFYLFDTGVQRALSKTLNLELTSGTSMYGNVFEHFIITQIINLSKYYKLDYEFSFFRTVQGEAEVDLIVDTPQSETFAIEIKAADTNLQPKDFRGLKHFAKINPKAQLICASLAPRRRLAGDIMIYPWQEVFELLGLS